MDSDDEDLQRNVKFDNDVDFENGQWIDDEFWASGQRRGRTQTKEEQIYGVFGQQQQGGRNSQRGPRRSNNLSGGISFVSSGIIQPSKDADKKAAEINKRAEEQKKNQNNNSDDKNRDQGKEKEEENTMSSSRGGLGGGSSRRTDAWGQRSKEKEKKRKAKRIKVDKDFAKFEQHTKGIGMKLLMKMGFKGRLGKREQGIAQPIVQKLRPRGMGLSYNSFKESNDSERFRNAEEEEAAAEKEEEQSKKEGAAEVGVSKADLVYTWKKDSHEKKKVVYKTATELRSEKTKGERAAPLQIVDMTGPAVKVYGLDKIGACTYNPTHTHTYKRAER